MPGRVHGSAWAAAAVVLAVAACGGGSVATPSVEEPPRAVPGVPAVEPVLAPAPVPTPSSPAVMPVPDGPVFRPAYHYCPGTMQIAQTGDATYVYYDAPGVGRVDRLDADGVRVAELDLVGTAPRPGCCGEPKWLRSGRWSPELPLGYLLDLAGADDGALYLAAAFHLHEQSWETRVFRRQGRRWRRVAGAQAQLLYPRAPGGLLGFGDEMAMGFLSPAFVQIGGRTAAPELWPLVEHAVRAGAGAGTARGDPSSGFSVLSIDVERDGRVLAVLTYELDGGDGKRVPVGTWLVAWTGEEPAAIERIDDAPAERARVLGDGAGGAWVLLDEALQRWRDGSFARVALPPLDGSGAQWLRGPSWRTRSPG